ncbi:hypothetical protein GFC01_06160 [Desulfofundulus thermobenzoicus]|uniref:Uncharacterized protein n=1 Tax=Desulfofundulus thermobenzoicus TaxID=29376 RepID=A0A6N7IPC5_9FIRM|nr:hypothetical protein [Desulfofundulus thermobenzoicus]MQL51854.1 hypothetical protein [Desulfofundulus thermobenzoicus]
MKDKLLKNADTDNIYQLILQMINEARTPEHIKRISMLADWLPEYLQMIREEDTFNEESIPYLKRGNIVLVNLGFNIGEELGG